MANHFHPALTARAYVETPLNREIKNPISDIGIIKEKLCSLTDNADQKKIIKQFFDEEFDSYNAETKSDLNLFLTDFILYAILPGVNKMGLMDDFVRGLSAKESLPAHMHQLCSAWLAPEQIEQAFHACQMQGEQTVVIRNYLRRHLKPCTSKETYSSINSELTRILAYTKNKLKLKHEILTPIIDACTKSTSQMSAAINRIVTSNPFYLQEEMISCCQFAQSTAQSQTRVPGKTVTIYPRREYIELLTNYLPKHLTMPNRHDRGQAQVLGDTATFIAYVKYQDQIASIKSLTDEIRHCEVGYHDRIYGEILRCSTPQNFAEALTYFRANIVQGVFLQNEKRGHEHREWNSGNDVHRERKHYIKANELGFGVPVGVDDVYARYPLIDIVEKGIEQSLIDAFNHQYTPTEIVNNLFDLTNCGYRGHDTNCYTGREVNRLFDFLKKYFPSLEYETCFVFGKDPQGREGAVRDVNWLLIRSLIIQKLAMDGHLKPASQATNKKVYLEGDLVFDFYHSMITFKYLDEIEDEVITYSSFFETHEQLSSLAKLFPKELVENLLNDYANNHLPLPLGAILSIFYTHNVTPSKKFLDKISTQTFTRDDLKIIDAFTDDQLSRLFAQFLPEIIKLFHDKKNSAIFSNIRPEKRAAILKMVLADLSNRSKFTHEQFISLIPILNKDEYSLLISTNIADKIKKLFRKKQDLMNIITYFSPNHELVNTLIQICASTFSENIKDFPSLLSTIKTCNEATAKKICGLLAPSIDISRHLSTLIDLDEFYFEIVCKSFQKQIYASCKNLADLTDLLEKMSYYKRGILIKSIIPCIVENVNNIEDLLLRLSVLSEYNFSISDATPHIKNKIETLVKNSSDLAKILNIVDQQQIPDILAMLKNKNLLGGLFVNSNDFSDFINELRLRTDFDYSLLEECLNIDANILKSALIQIHNNWNYRDNFFDAIKGRLAHSIKDAKTLEEMLRGLRYNERDCLLNDERINSGHWVSTIDDLNALLSHNNNATGFTKKLLPKIKQTITNATQLGKLLSHFPVSDFKVICDSLHYELSKTLVSVSDYKDLFANLFGDACAPLFSLLIMNGHIKSYQDREKIFKELPQWPSIAIPLHNDQHVKPASNPSPAKLFSAFKTIFVLITSKLSWLPVFLRTNFSARIKKQKFFSAFKEWQEIIKQAERKGRSHDALQILFESEKIKPMSIEEKVAEFHMIYTKLRESSFWAPSFFRTKRVFNQTPEENIAKLQKFATENPNSREAISWSLIKK